jgi:hydroxymethylglutaryl-CoA lyase
VGTPPAVERHLRIAGVDCGLHLHNGRGTALVNAYAAVQLGVTRFDASVGGLGGSPFADDAGGNLATEQLVYVLDALGHETGIDVEHLRKASLLVAALLGIPVPGRVASVGGC